MLMLPWYTLGTIGEGPIATSSIGSYQGKIVPGTDVSTFLGIRYARAARWQRPIV